MSSSRYSYEMNSTYRSDHGFNATQVLKRPSLVSAEVGLFIAVALLPSLFGCSTPTPRTSSASYKVGVMEAQDRERADTRQPPGQHAMPRFRKVQGMAFKLIPADDDATVWDCWIPGEAGGLEEGVNVVVEFVDDRLVQVRAGETTWEDIEAIPAAE